MADDFALSDEMSDVDDDDLLARALNEMDNKGPPPRAPPPAAKPAARAPTPPVRDDEDESDVDLLSLSSEDEDAPPQRRAPAAKVDALGIEIDSDLDEDESDEPSTWKHVDEEELQDRAQQLRSQAGGGMTVADGGARLQRRNSLLEKESAEGVLDPLGFGHISIKTLTLIRPDTGPASPGGSAVSPSGKKKGVFKGIKGLGVRREPTTPTDPAASTGNNDLPPPEPGAKDKVIIWGEKFDPKYYLARLHRETGIQDLEIGKRALERDLKKRKEQLKTLVKENFDCFISCKNTIDDIHTRMQQIEMDSEGAGTRQLSAAIGEVDKVAKVAFGELLERQAQADRIRGVQGLLQRFRTLFNLPATIRGHIRKREHELVVREYKKAKSLIAPFKTRILQRVLEEVDKVVMEFKESLYNSLGGADSDPHQVEATIRLLLELEPNSDPLWYYLQTQHARVEKMLESCAAEHTARMEALLNKVNERLQAELRWKQLQKEQRGDLDLGESAPPDEGRVTELAGEEADSFLGRQIRKLSQIIARQVPGFWHLWLAIYSGRFGKVTDTGVEKEAPSKGSNAPNVAKQFPGYYAEVEKDMHYIKHSKEEVEEMMLSLLKLYESKVVLAFQALAKATVLRPYMREAVQEVAAACTALSAPDSAPPSAVTAILSLRAEVTRLFVLRLCTLMRGTTPELSLEEDWVPVPVAARSQTPYAVSALPLQFGVMLATALDHVSDALSAASVAELSRDEALATAVQHMHESVCSTFFDCFLDYADCLSDLHERVSAAASDLELAGALSTRPGGALGQILGSEADYLVPTAGVEVTAPHMRMLMLLSNSGYARVHLLSELSRKYQHLWRRTVLNKAPPPGKVFRRPSFSYERNGEVEQQPEIAESGTSSASEVTKALTSLEEKVLVDYLQRKAAMLPAAVLAYLLEDGTNWGAAPPPRGLRDATLELMHPLVTAHAEVYAGARPFVGRAISTLAEGLISDLRDDVVDRIRALDIAGYSQLSLELDYLAAVLAPFSTPAMSDHLTAVHDILLDKVVHSSLDPEASPATGHSRRPSRSSSVDEWDYGGQGGPMGQPAPSVSGLAEEAQQAAQVVSAEFLQRELERTRTNVMCFKEGGLNEPDNAAGTAGQRGTKVTPAGQPSTGKRGEPSVTGPRMHRRSSSISSQESDEVGTRRLPPKSPMTYGDGAGAGLVYSAGLDAADPRARGASSAERFFANRQQRQPSSGFPARKADGYDLR